MLTGPVAGNMAIQTGEANSIYVINCDFSLIISGLIRECFFTANQRYLERSNLHNFKSNYVMRTAELM